MLYKTELIGLKRCLALIPQNIAALSTRRSSTQSQTKTTQEGSVYSGVVDNFFRERGYGFLVSRDLDSKVFCHYSEILHKGWKTLKKGQEVRFRIKKNQGRLQAKDIVPLKFNKEKGAMLIN